LNGKYLSISATARLLNQDHRKIQRLVRLGRLPGCRLGRNWIVSASLLYKFVSGIVQDFDSSPIGDLVQAPMGSAFSRRHNKLRLYVLKALKNS
jgi:excisionase family DNA binding protein